MTLVMAAAVAILFGSSVQLVMSRDVTRIVMGLLLVSNSTNLFLMAMGLSRGAAPLLPVPRDAPVADPLVQEGAPEIDHSARLRRGLLPGHRLAGEEAQDLGQGRVIAVADARIAALARALVQGGREIERATRHAPRADRLHPRLLHRFENVARRIAHASSERIQSGMPGGRPRSGIATRSPSAKLAA